MTIIEHKNNLQKLLGKKEQLSKNIKQIKNNIILFKKEKECIELCRSIFQLVAKQTQNEITFHLSSIVTLALKSIFGSEYEFILEFVEKRNKTEAEIYISKNGIKFDPMLSNGGGIIDVICFALRITMWKIIRNRNIIILDEPFKFLSRELQIKAGEMMKLLSQKLNIQFIIVSHDKNIIDCADKVFEIKLNNKISEIVNG